ncbi:MAG: DUF2147 domain-containing protein [Crocinitomix sp.]|nr:DUF2147 domain-containing protein [Crocinitomix sp.]
MFKSTLLIAFILLPFIGVSQAGSTAVIGTWLTQIEDAKVEIYKKNGKFCGRVVWIAEPTDEDGKAKIDEHNPDQKLAKRPIMGIDILHGFSYEDSEWSGGYIYDPKVGKTYDCKLWIEDGTLKVRGYIGWLFDTKTWTKVK